MSRVFEGLRLRCSIFGEGRPAFVTFDNFVLGKRSFLDFKPSMMAINAGFRHAIIQTSSNDWYLNSELDELRAAIRETAQVGAGSRAIGFSMGAFAALIIADTMELDKLFLVSPRFPRPLDWIGRAKIYYNGLLTDEGWRERLFFAAKITCPIHILFDPMNFDDRMAARWLEGSVDRSHSTAIAFGGHPCTNYIRDAMCFRTFQKILLERESNLSDVVRVKRSARSRSKLYKSNLIEYLNTRKNRVST